MIPPLVAPTAPEAPGATHLPNSTSAAPFATALAAAIGAIAAPTIVVPQGDPAIQPEPGVGVGTLDVPVADAEVPDDVLDTGDDHAVIGDAAPDDDTAPTPEPEGTLPTMAAHAAAAVVVAAAMPAPARPSASSIDETVTTSTPTVDANATTLPRPDVAGDGLTRVDHHGRDGDPPAAAAGPDAGSAPDEHDLLPETAQRDTWPAAVDGSTDLPAGSAAGGSQLAGTPRSGAPTADRTSAPAMAAGTTLAGSDTVRFLRELGPARAVQRLAVDLDGTTVAVRIDSLGSTPAVHVHVVDDPGGRLSASWSAGVERTLTHAMGHPEQRFGGDATPDHRRQQPQQQRDDTPAAPAATRWAAALESNGAGS